LVQIFSLRPCSQTPSVYAHISYISALMFIHFWTWRFFPETRKKLISASLPYDFSDSISIREHISTLVKVVEHIEMFFGLQYKIPMFAL
jgi:hypothetical protein